MKESIKKYAKIGLVYHLLYPKCAKDPVYHIRTLTEFIHSYDIETFDCILPFGDEHRKKLIPLLKNCGKEIVFNNHISLLKKLNLSASSYVDYEMLKIIFEDQIKTAKNIGALGYVFNSGKNVKGKYKREALKKFRDFCSWFCQKLSKYNIMAMIEPFDYSVDKKFLIGPTSECADFVRSLHIENLGIELDFAHVPLLGESFYDAVKNTSQYLKRVHLGNCVLKNFSSKWYGDKHPPIGIKDGEIDIKEIAEILSLLLKFGYLNKNERGPLVLEIRPYDNLSQEETVADNFMRLNEAWNLI